MSQPIASHRWVLGVSRSLFSKWAGRVIPFLIGAINAEALPLSSLWWSEDSAGAAHVTVTGQLSTDGLPVGHFTSPTALWDFDFHFGYIFLEDLDRAVFLDGFIVRGRFNGPKSFDFTTPGGFGETYNSFPASSSDGIGRNTSSDFEYIGEGRIEFQGGDFNALSTWNYTFDVSVNIPPPVPERGTTALLAAPAIAALVIASRKRRRRAAPA